MKKTDTQEYQTDTDKIIGNSPLSMVSVAIRKYGFLGSVARYLLMLDEVRKFVNRGVPVEERAFRRYLIRQFGIIQKRIPCAHSPYQFVLMADYLLKLKEPGPIVQCGCFKGGSTAKLSLLAKRINSRLYVCDSFQGLPAPESKEEQFLKGHSGCVDNYAFSAGEYKGLLQEVKENVSRYGCIESCTFVPGLFKDSLAGLDVKPAFVFIDVDYVSSARDCLQYLWPRLVPGGHWFTHEAIFPYYVEGILDAKWWQEILGESPPVIYGAGKGLSPLCEALAYFRKGELVNS